LDREALFALRYPLIGNDFLSGFIETERTVVLQSDTSAVLLNKELPERLDVSSTRYGLETLIERLDYRFNPRRGFAVQIKAGAGSRRILENSEILALQDPDDPEFDFASLYDSVETQSLNFSLEYMLDYFQPLRQRGVLFLRARGAWIGGGELLQNELFRLGGARLLRGFDEESIFASRYHLFTAEWRYLLGRNSYAALFSDVALLEEDRSGYYANDLAIGFGAGLNFETPAGVFGISYALGRLREAPVDFRAAKIHFGYVNRF
jgi:hypothetical protein